MFHVEQIPPSVKLMAVTKGHTVEEIQAILERYPIALIGENRWQEAKNKLNQLPSTIPKHFIGHVQTNKIKEIITNFECIESVDSTRLLEIIDKSVEILHKKYPIFLQVNISNDPGKHGFKIDELDTAVTQCQKMFHVELLGLMTITARQNMEDTRRDFKLMKKLQNKYQLSELSMGMSNDWDIAIEEGATIIRIGKALFN